MPLTETLWWNGDPDADRETPLGRGDHLGWVAWHYVQQETGHGGTESGPGAQAASRDR
jgi:hypothetical protein